MQCLYVSRWGKRLREKPVYAKGQSGLQASHSGFYVATSAQEWESRVNTCCLPFLHSTCFLACLPKQIFAYNRTQLSRSRRSHYCVLPRMVFLPNPLLSICLCWKKGEQVSLRSNTNPQQNCTKSLQTKSNDAKICENEIFFHIATYIFCSQFSLDMNSP